MTAHTPTRFALLGCGNIGGALAHELCHSSTSNGLHLCAALVRDARRARPACIAPESVVTSLDTLIARCPAIAVECLGGVEPAATYCERLLRAGIHVVSANKSMIAAALPRLSAAAHAGNAQLRFDASVCAGVPVLDAVWRLRSAGITGIHGIVNGTCNFVLHTMQQRNAELHDALQEAIQRGYAEPDPTADTSGRDSAEKLCLLSAAAGLGLPPLQSVAVRGISGLDRETLNDVRALGHSVRLMVHATNNQGALELSVHPTVVPFGGTFASATGTQNIVAVTTRLAGTVILSGPGAGANPTVAALVADIEACRLGQPAWASGAAAPSTAAALGAHNWLLRASVPHAAASNLLRPDFQRFQALGASVVGSAYLGRRLLVQLSGSARTAERAATSLAHDGAAVQLLGVEPDVSLRF